MRTILPLLFFLSHGTWACTVMAELTQAKMDKADAVFVGRLMLIQKGRLVYQVETVEKGKLPGKVVDVEWQNGTFGQIDSVDAFQIRFGLRNRVGIVFPENIAKGKGLPLPFRPEPGQVFTKPWVIGELCSLPFIVNAEK